MLPVCSLTLSETIHEQLKNLGGNGVKVENLMSNRAWAANVNKSGTLDAPITYLKSGFAEDLRKQGVRKETIFGHRVFFIGNHFDCNYTAFFIKLNKKADNKQHDDNNPVFHEVLRRALAGQKVRVIPDPKQVAEIEEARKEAVPDWQKDPWFLEQAKYRDESES